MSKEIGCAVGVVIVPSCVKASSGSVVARRGQGYDKCGSQCEEERQTLKKMIIQHKKFLTLVKDLDASTSW